jgi:putative addiction module killer protein
VRIVVRKEVEYYKLHDGRCPYVEWLDTLDSKMQAIVIARVARIESGNMGHVESLGEGVHEFKIDFGPGLRIYFGSADERLVVLLAGGDKRTQTEDIMRAKLLWKEWKAMSSART